MKEFKPNNYLFPMPVLIIATYNDDGSVDLMNAAWGTMEDMDVIELELTSDHKTSENIQKRKALTIAFADKKNVIASDYVGIVSGNTEKNKFEKSGLHAEKSKTVDAPLIVDFPVSAECVLDRIVTENGDFQVYCRIKAIQVREDCLDEKGKLDIEKCEFITYNSVDHSYRVLGEKVADAFKVGLKLK